MMQVLKYGIIFQLFFRKKSFESSLNSELWRVKAEDVTFTKKQIGSTHSRRSMVSIL
jgi:hypothetical protein